MMNWMTASDPQDTLGASDAPGAPPPAPAGGAEAQEPMSMPLSSMTRGLGAAEGEPGLIGQGSGDDSGPRSLLNNNAALLAGLVVIAVASILVMRWSQASLDDPASGVVSAKIDTALARLKHPDRLARDSPLRPDVRRAMFQDTDKIVAMFTIDPTRHQVPLAYTQKNPFRIESGKPQVAKGAGSDAAAAARRREARLKKLRRAAKGMTLQSVMDGKTPVAVIDGEFYRVGDKVGGFTVAKISRFAVKLVAGKEHFKLAMNQ